MKTLLNIMSLKKEQSLKKIESEIAFLKAKEAAITEQEAAFKAAIKPIRKTISVEEMVEEQNYKPIEREHFYKQVVQLQIEESLEELLKMLD
jgi:calcineurin-like phosphoesterase family protein